MTRTVLAAFDVDKTLTTRDCVLPFLKRCAPLPVTVGRLLHQGVSVTRAVIGRDRDHLKQLGTRAALAGRYMPEVESLGTDYAHHIAQHWLRTDSVGRLKWHRQQGHQVVLVSASYEIYLQPLGTLLGAQAVLATRLQVNEDHCTGELEGANCRGEEKVRRLLGWISHEIGSRSEVELWAYGDSPGDRAMLAAADHPVWVKADPLSPVPWSER
jgi:phosphatidylglycerophosphatase C